jgi:hypothetical protein
VYLLQLLMACHEASVAAVRQDVGNRGMNGHSRRSGQIVESAPRASINVQANGRNQVGLRVSGSTNELRPAWAPQHTNPATVHFSFSFLCFTHACNSILKMIQRVQASPN